MCPGRELWSGSVFYNVKPKCRDSSAQVQLHARGEESPPCDEARRADAEVGRDRGPRRGNAGGARSLARSRKGDERLIRTQLQNNAQKILSCYNHA